ncbi:hypothetical protein QEN58_03815 [Halomonas alkaliantarctica]|uniref:Restriction endonuclease n=1 Tax=Halomonas alkaliantarctica TaxID=232346 RepID=A0ABY8LRG3_9GAMM|nr:hypothetical protein [Halomonas alkaliantarctica]WGI26194.1 hypothetical protein QEN58_03815 [Halomonas alkaliantarctica]
MSRGPDPSDWIAPSLPAGWRLLSFHFFVDWMQSPPRLANRVWMTRQVRFEHESEMVEGPKSDLLRLFNQSEDWRFFEDLERVCSNYRHDLSAILLPDIPVSVITEQTPVWVIRRAENTGLGIGKYSVSNLKTAIQRHSGGPVNVGKKGLTFGTSAVECFLSGSDAAFPGDADGVVVDDQNQVRFIIEFKKHTIGDALDNHLINRYYPSRDGRKYKRLEALRTHYECVNQFPTPLVMLYFSTREPVIRLQEIGRLNDDSVDIRHDSGNINTNGMHPDAISKQVVQWLGIQI